MNWNLRYAFVGNSGIDYSTAAPCSGKNCGFCRHLDNVEAKHRGNNDMPDGEAQVHLESVKKVREMHQNIAKGAQK